MTHVNAPLPHKARVLLGWARWAAYTCTFMHPRAARIRACLRAGNCAHFIARTRFQACARKQDSACAHELTCTHALVHKLLALALPGFASFLPVSQAINVTARIADPKAVLIGPCVLLWRGCGHKRLYVCWGQARRPGGVVCNCRAARPRQTASKATWITRTCCLKAS